MSNLVLMKFGAQWCAPCKQLDRVLDEVNLGDVEIQFFDIDDQPELAREFGVRGIPTLVLMKDGEEFARTTGVKTADQLTAFVGA